ncbi:MAG: tetratricopeptide repeat protein [Verrucomicrobiota bacterium]
MDFKAPFLLLTTCFVFIQPPQSFSQEAPWLPAEGRFPLQSEPPAAPENPPDLILEPKDSFTLPANGQPLIRSFIVPATQLKSARHLQSLELLPGSEDVVQHAVIRLDLTADSRKLDAKDKAPGFPWRPELASLRRPEALFTVWTPRASVSEAPLGTGWRVHPETDFVVTLHLKPNGSPQEIRPMIACWFASEPIHHVLALRMANETIEIQAMSKEYSVRDSFVVPVATKLHGIYPVANALAESVRLDIYRPEAQGERVFEIRDWQANAQEDYKFKEPVELPAGTRLEMKYVYSNFSDQKAMPTAVKWGPTLSDEVGELYLQLVVDHEAKAVRLAHSINRHQLALAIERAERRFDPDSEAHAELAYLYADLGNHETAVAHGQKALAEAEKTEDISLQANAHGALGAAYLTNDFQFSAEEHLKKATELDPDNPNHWFNLGNVYLNYKVSSRAIENYSRALELNSRDARILNNLGTAHLTKYDPSLPKESISNLKEARKHLEVIIDRYPRHSLATANLARTQDLLGEKKEAIRLYKRAMMLAPGMAPTLNPLLAQLESTQ